MKMIRNIVIVHEMSICSDHNKLKSTYTVLYYPLISHAVRVIILYTNHSSLVYTAAVTGITKLHVTDN